MLWVLSDTVKSWVHFIIDDIVDVAVCLEDNVLDLSVIVVSRERDAESAGGEGESYELLEMHIEIDDKLSSM